MQLAREVPTFGLLHFHQATGKPLKSLAGILEFCLGLFALGDVAGVALNHFSTLDLIDVAKKLDIDGPAVAGFQRQVIVTDKGFTLELSKLCLGGVDILEGAD